MAWQWKMRPKIGVWQEAGVWSETRWSSSTWLLAGHENVDQRWRGILDSEIRLETG